MKYKQNWLNEKVWEYPVNGSKFLIIRKEQIKFALVFFNICCLPLVITISFVQVRWWAILILIISGIFPLIMSIFVKGIK